MSKEENAIARLVGSVANSVALLDQDHSAKVELFPLAWQGAEAKMFDSEVEKLAGKKEIRGVYLAHRFSVIVFPDTFKQGDANPDPIAGGAVGAADPLAKLIKDASAAVQFTKADQRSDKFNYDATGAGLPRPNLEILVYNADIDGLCVLRPYGHYQAIYQKGRTLARLLDLANTEGVIRPAPIAFKCVVSEGFGKPLAWLSSEVVLDDGVYQAFTKWASSADAETSAAAEEWVACKDNPMTERTIACLEKARAVNPPRY
jgi:hypothetical protein